jgi:ribosomal protein S7
MPRRGNVPKREVLPDPVYQSPLVTRFINCLSTTARSRPPSPSSTARCSSYKSARRTIRSRSSARRSTTSSRFSR